VGKKSWLFSKIIKKKPGSPDQVFVAEPVRPLHIIPKHAVVIRTDPGYKDITEAVSFNKRSEGIVKRTVKDNLHEGAIAGIKEETPEYFDRNHIDNLLAEKSRELEEYYTTEKERAYQNGYEQGKAEGFNEGAKSLAPLEILLENIDKEVIASREHLLKNAEEVMGRLSLEIAEAVIGEAAMKLSGELLEYNLKRCLEVLSGSGVVTIKVNPSDYDTIKEKIDVVFKKNKDRFSFKFEPDSSITPGGCFIESPGGAIDGRIENQFNLIKENFLQMI
jgi:flagellar assembly protein FliH